MNSKKHVFKIVAGEPFSDTSGIPIFEKAPKLFPHDIGYKKHSEYNIAKVNFEALDDESKIELNLPLQSCQIKEFLMSNRHTKEMLCLKEDGEKLNLCTMKWTTNINNDSDKDYVKVELDEVPSLIKGKNYSLSIFDKESGECCIKSEIRTDSSFDLESTKKSLSNFSTLLNDVYEETYSVMPELKGKRLFSYPAVSAYDQADNKIASIPGLSLAYFNNNLVEIKMMPLAGQGSLCVFVTPQKHEYITLEGNGDDYQLYLSDNQGNRAEDENPNNPVNLMDSIVLNNIILCNDYSNFKDLEEVTSSNSFTKVFVQNLAEEQLKTLTNTLNDKQVQALTEHLTDKQLQTFVGHLTHHQLQTLAHNMSDQQFIDLLNELTTESLKDIIYKLPHEKVKDVVDDSGKSDTTTEVLKEKLDKQNKLIDELREELKELITPPPMDSPYNIEVEYYGLV